MSKVITNENQLNTEVDDLVTENYALEVLGLKNPADFRKFSRSFMKLSKIVKGIDDSNVGKLDKGAVSSEYDTAKKIEDKIKTAQGTADNKLNKGNVLEKYNTAEKIGNEVDGKVSKNGDTINGNLNVKSKLIGNQVVSLDEVQLKFSIGNSPWARGFEIYCNDKHYGGFGCFGENGDGIQYTYVGGTYDSPNIKLYKDGITAIKATNLQTINKEVINGINEILTGHSGLSISTKYIQDVGIKTRNVGYIDKVTGKLYVCYPKDTTIDSVSDTNVTDNFVLATNVENAKRLNSLGSNTRLVEVPVYEGVGTSTIKYAINKLNDRIVAVFTGTTSSQNTFSRDLNIAPLKLGLTKSIVIRDDDQVNTDYLKIVKDGNLLNFINVIGTSVVKVYNEFIGG